MQFNQLPEILEKPVTFPLTGEYDINVGANDIEPWVTLAFYPLLFVGDEDYPFSELDHGFPMADYTRCFALRIPIRARGPRQRETLAYLEALVNEGSFAPEWNFEDMNWTSNECVLTSPPELIREFVEKLPRRGQVKENN